MLLNSVLYKIKNKTNWAILEDIVAEKTKQKQ